VEVIFRPQLVEKIDFAHEVGFLNQFFATGFPGQKTLLSQQVYWKRLRLIPYARGLHFIFDKMRKAWQSQASGFVRRKSPFRGFFDGLPHVIYWRAVFSPEMCSI